MASLRLVLSHDPERLLRAAGEGFFDVGPGAAADPFPSPRALLALRQGGLRDDFYALAASLKCPGWFDPPICVFHELPDWLGATAREPLGDFERLALIASVLRRTDGEIVARLARSDEFLDSTDRWFGELASEGVSPDEYDSALARRATRDDFERRRDAELSAAWRAYVAELAAQNRRDGRDTLLDCAEAVRADPDALAARLRGRRDIRLFGLQDLRGGWRALLRALRDSPSLDVVSIYTSVPLDLDAELGAAPTTLDERDDSLAAALFSEPLRRAGAGGPRCTAVSAPDAEREAEEVARRIRALIDGEGGAPPVRPDRIAVVSRVARPHVDLAIDALRRFGVPATARRRVALEEIPAVRGVLALFAAAAEGWTRHGLVELAEHPYVGCDLDPRVLDFVGYRRRVEGLDAWASALRSLEGEAARRADREAAGELGESERRRPLPPAERIARCREGFARFASRARALDGERPLGDWLRWLARFLEEDPFGCAARIDLMPEGRHDILRLDLGGWNGLRGIVAEWRAAIERWPDDGAPADAAGFELQLRRMLRGEVALWSETMHGVRVLEGLAAAYRTFDHVFVVGLEAGGFPRRAPRSPLLDDGDREALVEGGLPLDRRETWDDRERELFRTLVAGARESLTLSFARLDADGREVIGSAFLEELGDVVALESEEVATSRVLTPTLPLHREPEVAGHAARVARIERERETGALGPYNGLVQDERLVAWLAEQFGDGKVWSPTQLEEYAKCPWAYLAGRLLRVELREDPDQDMDHATRGVILHAALKGFYDGVLARTGGEPVMLRGDDAAWAHEELERALDAAIVATEGRGWIGSPALREAKTLELRRLLRKYLDFEIALNEKHFSNRSPKSKLVRTGVAEHELAFDDLVLERGGVRFCFRGSIDRVEACVDERCEDGPYIAAVDYKTSTYSTPGGGDKAAWEDGVVLQVPLYAHALSLLKPEGEVTRVEYRSLKQRAQVHTLDLHGIDKAGNVSPNEESAEQLERALDAVAEHVLAAREGRFPAKPPASCGCPSFCHSWDICRTAGGPKEKSR